jgi:hypothetical protein
MDETEFTLDNTRRENDDGCHHSNRSAAFESNDDSDSGLALAASFGPPEEDRVGSLAEEWSSSTGSERLTGSPVSIDRSSGSCSSSSNSGIRGPKGRSRDPEVVESEEEVVVIVGDDGKVRRNNSFGLECNSDAAAFETHL